MSEAKPVYEFELSDAGKPGTQAATEIILRYALEFAISQLRDRESRVSILEQLKQEVAAELGTGTALGDASQSPEEFRVSANNVISRVFDTLIAKQRGS